LSQWGRLISNIVSVFVVVVVAGLTSLAVGPALAGYGPVVVTTGSMEPSLRPADVVVTGTPTPEKIAVGTVINFRSGEDTRIHRVIGVGADGYRTKGDANQTADSETVTFDDVKGVGFYLVPLVGYPRMWMDAGEWWKVLLALMVLVSCAYFSRVEWLMPSRSSEAFEAAVPVRRNVRELAQ
jgi:signal peptidase